MKFKKGVSPLVGLGILLFILIGMFYLLHGCQQNTTDFNKQSKSDQNYDVYDMAKSVVSENLKSPNSANFPDITRITIVNQNNNEFEVDGYVNAQNGLGTNLRTNFKVKLKVNNTLKDGQYKFNSENCVIHN